MGWPFREAKVRGPLRWTFSRLETALTGVHCDRTDDDLLDRRGAFNLSGLSVPLALTLQW